MTSSTLRLGRVPGNGPSAGALLILATILATAFATSEAFGAMAALWSREEYSHAWLIMPLAALLLVHRYSDAPSGGTRWVGVVLSAIAAVSILAGVASRSQPLSIYGWILGIAGVVWASTGSRGMRVLAAPIGFLVFMIPLPLAVYIEVSNGMRHVSSQIGLTLMEAAGLQASLDGNVIALAAGQLEVAEACNGLRYLFPLLSVGYLIAVVMQDRPWKRLTLVASAVPVAVVVNGIRLAMTAALVDRYGMGMAEGVPHDLLGFVLFGFCVALLLGEAALLRRLPPEGRPIAFDALVPTGKSLSAATRWAWTAPMRASCAILLAAAVLAAVMPARIDNVPVRRPLTLFPMELGTWGGKPTTLDPAIVQALGMTDYVLADYMPQGKPGYAPVNLYVAYYATQKFGTQVHSPRLCIPGGGWAFESERRVAIPMPDGSATAATRAVIEKGGTRQLVYYWFDQRGRQIDGELKLKAYAFLDSITRHRSDGALVRLVTPIREGDEASAETELLGLARALHRILPTYVPS